MTCKRCPITLHLLRSLMSQKSYANTNLILVGCVSGKNDGPCKARDLYKSPLWKGRRAYAEKSGLPWYILSAKHGLLDPDTSIERYNRALTDLSPDERRDWSRRVLNELKEKVPVLSGKVIEVHAGGNYLKYGLEHGLLEVGAIVHKPLANVSGNGPQINWYKDRLSKECITEMGEP